jgi:hypothetical protein
VSEAAVTAAAAQTGSKKLAGFVAAETCAGLVVASAWRWFPASPTLVAWGALSALAAGLVTLYAVHVGLRRGVNGLLAAISVGFLLRTLLLGLGFVGSGARAAPFEFVIPFFAIYAATQVAEIVYVVQHNARGSNAAGGTASQ